LNKCEYKIILPQCFYSNFSKPFLKIGIFPRKIFIFDGNIPIMSFRPLDGFIDFPQNAQPEDPHMGLTFDYEFAGKRMGDQVSLLIHSWVIDYQGNIFSRKGSYILPRIDAVDCLTKHIRDHIVFLGLDDMSCRRLMRDFELDNKKCIIYNSLEFSKGLR
jgi:hypothetical protein